MTRLRYLSHDLEVPEGQFAIGRSSECQLSLDDPLVSRRHALLVVRGDTVEVEDLGSRNGVLVNGVRIARPTRLVDGDVLTVGQQQLTIVGAKPGPPPALRIGRPDVPRVADTIVASSDEDGGIHTTDDETRFHLSTQIRSDRPDRRVHALSLIGAVADKALTLGRPEEAERLLRRPLEALLERVRGGSEAPELEATIARATELCLRVAEGSGSPDGLHFLFDLYAARGEPMPSATVDRFHELLRNVRVDLRRLRAYLDVLHAQEARFGPADRFLVSRIEGLERVAALK